LKRSTDFSRPKQKNIFSQLFLGPRHPSFSTTAAATGWPQVSPRRRRDNDGRMDNAGKRGGGEERQRVRKKLEKKSHPLFSEAPTTTTTSTTSTTATQSSPPSPEW